MNTILFLTIFPLIASSTILLIRVDVIRNILVIATSVAIAVVSVFLFIQYSGSAGLNFDFRSYAITHIMLVVEVCIAAAIIILGFKYKKYMVSILAVTQTSIIIWFERVYGHDIYAGSNINIDNLSLIIILINCIIGAGICIYALTYTKEFHKRHLNENDKRYLFFCPALVIISAMVGVALSNNLLWLYFSWKIITICSCLLIRYSNKPDTTENAFKALSINLAGSLSFAIGILLVGIYHGTLELDKVIALGIQGDEVVLISIALIALAALIKAAQMPFTGWLHGVVTAPAHVSALLHSSTMTIAGVFLLIKLSPALGLNMPGIMVMMVGGITFIIASFTETAQNNVRKMMTYSTMSYIGLVVACVGVGAPGTVWASIMLIMFHAITKALMFLCVGTAENIVGSKAGESLHKLFSGVPRLAGLMIIGIAGGFSALLGIFIFKEIAMTALADSMNILLIIMIIFGGTATIFCKANRIGKAVAAIVSTENVHQKPGKSESSVLYTLASLAVLTCLLFPVVSYNIVIPYLESIFRGANMEFQTVAGMLLMSAAMAAIIAFPVFLPGKIKKTRVKIEPTHINKYLETHFDEAKMNKIGNVASSFVIVTVFAIMMGGVLL